MAWIPQDAALRIAQQEGAERLQSQNRTQGEDLLARMGATGTFDPAVYDKNREVHMAAQEAAQRKLNALLQQAQMRSDIHSEKLKELLRQWKREKKARRNAMIGSGVSSAAMMAPGIWDALTPAPQQPVYGGYLEGATQGPMQTVPESWLSKR